MSHTEGPWAIYPETDGSEICAVDMVKGLPIRQVICHMVRGPNWIANASLIAAAPALLAAVNNLHRVKGRFHTEQAYKELIQVVDSIKG